MATQAGGARALAHPANESGAKHDLVDHLEGVAATARKLGEKIGAPEVASTAGLLHDVGKFSPAFQQYLQDCMEEPDKKHRGPDHSSAGAVLAADRDSHLWDAMAFALAGHHSGLPDRSDLKSRLAEKSSDAAVSKSLELARATIPNLLDAAPLVDKLPSRVKCPANLELFLRLLFSILADADFLDTERHFDLDRAETQSSDRERIETAFNSKPMHLRPT